MRTVNCTWQPEFQHYVVTCGKDRALINPPDYWIHRGIAPNLKNCCDVLAERSTPKSPDYIQYANFKFGGPVKIRAGDVCAAHHPRGGIVRGPVSKVKKGLYCPEREINGMSFPASQIWKSAC